MPTLNNQYSSVFESPKTKSRFLELYMKNKPFFLPRFLHYFLAAMLLDFVVIAGVFSYFSAPNGIQTTPISLMYFSWLLANIILYPTSNQRYVSFVHTYYRIVKLYALFGAFYWIAVRVSYGHWVLDINYVKFLSILLAAILINKTLFVLLVRAYRSLGYGVSNYMIVSQPRSAVVFRRMMNKRKKGGYKFCCSIDDWHPYITTKNEKAFTKVLKENSVDEIYLYPTCKKETVDFIQKIAALTNVHTFLIPTDTTRHVHFYNFRKINFADYQTITDGPLIHNWPQFLKRGFDIAFSLFVIVFILSWLLPILGLIIKLESKGSMFFIQPRAGLNGKMFNCFKLRSMRNSATAHTKQATRKDPRITKVGAFIRATSLDELPQFFNVLLGNMSIVGPRPHIKVLNDKFSPIVPDYDKRFLVKPGITGLAQAFGYRGETKDVEDMTQRVQADVLYVQNWSLLLDIRIVFRTVFQSFISKDTNAY